MIRVEPGELRVLRSGQLSWRDISLDIWARRGRSRTKIELLCSWPAACRGRLPRPHRILEVLPFGQRDRVELFLAGFQHRRITEEHQIAA